MEKDIERVVINRKEIAERLNGLSKNLIEDYNGKEWTVIAVLNGSLVFLADLIRLIPCSLRLDTITASTYGDSTFPKGETKLLGSIKEDIKGRDVLIIDDIVDTGSTLRKVIKEALRYDPKSIKSCVLLNRPDRRDNDFEPDYCGFVVGNDYVVGYGLDYDNRYRNLPYIGALKPEVFQKSLYR